MKEATGELNATVVVVLTIGLLSTFFFTVIWPRLKSNLNANTKCSSAICKVEKDKSGNMTNCTERRNGVCLKMTCKYKQGKDKYIDIVCPFKG